MSIALAVVISALAGFVSLSYEILWIRVIAVASHDEATAFGFLLGAYLAGIALGALGVSKLTQTDPAGLTPPRRGVVATGAFIAAANAMGYAVVPLVAWLVTTGPWTWMLPVVGLSAALLGAVMPLAAHFAIPPDERVGARLSYLYVANIVGSSVGSTLTGFLILDMLTMAQAHTLLFGMGSLVGFSVAATALPARGRIAAGALVAVALAGVVLAEPVVFDRLWERLHFQEDDDGERSFALLIENRHGVIAIEPDGTTYGGGLYDGRINTRIEPDTNNILRAYSVAAFHPKPKRVLLIGLATGSWAQVVANLDGVEEVVAIEINPGYLDAIAANDEVSSLLDNPKVRVEVDDGRRWMRRHPDDTFDVIVQNTTWHWRAHAANLLSEEYLELTRSRLAPGGQLLINTTSSEHAMVTGMAVFQHAVRIYNCLVLSDSPVAFDDARWRSALTETRIDGRLPCDPTSDACRARIDTLLQLGASLLGPPIYEALESKESLSRRLAGVPTITDDNMLTEFLWLYREPE